MHFGGSFGFLKETKVPAPSSVVVDHLHEHHSVLADRVQSQRVLPCTQRKNVDADEPLHQSLLPHLSDVRQVHLEYFPGRTWFGWFWFEMV